MGSLSVTTQMTAAEQYFPVVLFIMRYKWFRLFSLQTKPFDLTIQMKADKQYFPGILFTLLHRTRWF